MKTNLKTLLRVVFVMLLACLTACSGTKRLVLKANPTAKARPVPATTKAETKVKVEKPTEHTLPIKETSSAPAAEMPNQSDNTGSDTNVVAAHEPLLPEISNAKEIDPLDSILPFMEQQRIDQGAQAQQANDAEAVKVAEAQLKKNEPADKTIVTQNTPDAPKTHNSGFESAGVWPDADKTLPVVQKNRNEDLMLHAMLTVDNFRIDPNTDLGTLYIRALDYGYPAIAVRIRPKGQVGGEFTVITPLDKTSKTAAAYDSVYHNLVGSTTFEYPFTIDVSKPQNVYDVDLIVGPHVESVSMHLQRMGDSLQDCMGMIMTGSLQPVLFPHRLIANARQLVPAGTFNADEVAIANNINVGYEAGPEAPKKTPPNTNEQAESKGILAELIWEISQLEMIWKALIVLCAFLLACLAVLLVCTNFLKMVIRHGFTRRAYRHLESFGFLRHQPAQVLPGFSPDLAFEAPRSDDELTDEESAAIERKKKPTMIVPGGPRIVMGLKGDQKSPKPTTAARPTTGVVHLPELPTNPGGGPELPTATLPPPKDSRGSDDPSADRIRRIKPPKIRPDTKGKLDGQNTLPTVTVLPTSRVARLDGELESIRVEQAAGTQNHNGPPTVLPSRALPVQPAVPTQQRIVSEPAKQELPPEVVESTRPQVPDQPEIEPEVIVSTVDLPPPPDAQGASFLTPGRLLGINGRKPPVLARKQPERSPSGAPTDMGPSPFILVKSPGKQDQHTPEKMADNVDEPVRPSESVVSESSPEEVLPATPVDPCPVSALPSEATEQTASAGVESAVAA